MIEPDRPRGILTTDDRDYLKGRKDLKSGSERNARSRIRDRTRNGLYDFAHLQRDLSSDDLSQLVTDSGGPDDRMFEAAEEMVAFIFRMCAQAPDTPGEAADDRFEQIILNGVQKAIKDDYEVTNFHLEMNYGLPKEEREHLRRKVQDGERLRLSELREALENDYFDDSFRFSPVGEHGLPKNVDPEDTLSHDDYSGYPRR